MFSLLYQLHSEQSLAIYYMLLYVLLDIFNLLRVEWVSYHTTSLNELMCIMDPWSQTMPQRFIGAPSVLDSAWPCFLVLFTHIFFIDSLVPHREGKMSTGNPSSFPFICDLVNDFQIWQEDSNWRLCISYQFLFPGDRWGHMITAEIHMPKEV